MNLPRGMKDFESAEQSKIEFVRQKFLETSKSFGFHFMSPSPLEMVSVIEAKSGPAIRDEIYFFKDKGDREIALRFDFTVGLTRFVVEQKSLKMPAKISAFGGVWRYDEPQKGRYRYFHQWDLEVYGKPSLESDAEIIEFTSKFFSKLNLQNITIDISHRKLVEAVVEKIFESTDPKTIGDIFRAIDKIQKKKKDEIISEYTQKGYAKEKLEQILEFSKVKGSPESVESTFDVSKIAAWTELKELFVSLKNRGVTNIRINFGIVRGLDYYSGVVFEAFDTSSEVGALVGGGRYDSLPKAFGRDDIGATGVAGGVERIILSLEAQGLQTTQTTNQISVLFVNDEMAKPAMSIASKLRDQGLEIEIDLVGRSFKKQMENASNSKFAIIIAPKEFSAGQVIIKNMSDGKEATSQIESLLSNPKSFIQ
ncbi:histidine--tRNA ligase [Candidatus Nitrosotenuis cloacae]|uniref:Histidine--tRNA ligase n=1 Tax=Candidatus Nitrosotenuis cloacae TaxID=1603555 RepID=A0A3G1B3F2_9ARCH|nr:histidine--tRNA ligase [Candidatus Nitrosotenuis cloacae]AJZ76290.1 histidyl-tRNA synthetase [Candidatus Nitrosotenuis cloacae]